MKQNVMKAQFQYHVDASVSSKQQYIDSLVKGSTESEMGSPISKSSIVSAQNENGLDIFKFSGGVGSIGYIIPRKVNFSEVIYVIVWNPDSTLEKILSTFKFIDETADWKIFRNETYGLELMYPPTYSVRPRIYEVPNVINKSFIFEGPEGNFDIHLAPPLDEFKGKSEEYIISSSLCNTASVYGDKIKKEFIRINNILFYELWLGNFTTDSPVGTKYPEDANITYCFLGKNGGLFSLSGSPSLPTEKQLDNFSAFLRNILLTVSLSHQPTQ